MSRNIKGPNIKAKITGYSISGSYTYSAAPHLLGKNEEGVTRVSLYTYCQENFV
jgi:hypothetical protein